MMTSHPVTPPPSPGPTRLFLFDIDWTLVDTRGAGRRAFDRTFREILGVADAFEGFSFQGQVDKRILRTIYARFVAAPLTPELETTLTDAYLDRLEEELARPNIHRVLPGVRETLDLLAALPGARLGLATGNFERGAQLKLRPGGIDHFFSFGGFGSDSDDRAELTRLAVRRGSGDGPRPPRDHVFVIGDTAFDVMAAHAVGATAIAVASGGVSAEELRRYHPTLTLESLRDPATWLSRIL